MGYKILNVITKGDEPEEIEIFVGRRNGALHLLGHRPVAVKYMFTERECAALDLGIVVLPEDRKSIDDLVKGDVLRVVKEDGSPGPLNGVIYQRKRR